MTKVLQDEEYFDTGKRGDLILNKGIALHLSSSSLRRRTVPETEVKVDVLAFLPFPCSHLMLIFLPWPLNAAWQRVAHI